MGVGVWEKKGLGGGSEGAADRAGFCCVGVCLSGFGGAVEGGMEEEEGAGGVFVKQEGEAGGVVEGCAGADPHSVALSLAAETLQTRKSKRQAARNRIARVSKLLCQQKGLQGCRWKQTRTCIYE